MAKLAFLGAGAMAQALVRGLVGAKLCAPDDIVLLSASGARARDLADELGARAATSAREAAQNAEIVVLAMKPHQLEGALGDLREEITPAQLVVSVLAGASTARVEACFAQSVPVVRAMPNTPSLVGAGAAAICAGQYASDADLARARALFEAVGLCVTIPESQMDGVVGVSGSGPAYVFAFIEALADGGVRAGLPRATAQQLAAQTVLGAAQMVLQTGDHPGVLKDRVASPGGTTIAALHELERGGFRGVVMDAVVAAAERSRELGA